jgi:hypothetical protein
MRFSSMVVCFSIIILLGAFFVLFWEYETGPVARASTDVKFPVTTGKVTVVATNRRGRDQAGINETKTSRRKQTRKPGRIEDVWRSKDLSILAIGMGIGDVDGDGNNDVVLIGPSTVHLYRFSAGVLTPVTTYDAGSLELKSVDVTKIRKQGPARIYVSAQNRGSIASFVLEYRGGKLSPIISNLDYYLRKVDYPTRGPILLGQRKGLTKIYDGPIFRLEDRGDELVSKGRFGVPLKIPIFGFAIGDFDGTRKPIIAVYDREDHLRLYEPSGKRIYLSQDSYGGSDVVLRLRGHEERDAARDLDVGVEKQYFRPRIAAEDLDHDGVYELLVIAHSSATYRVLANMRMFSEGEVISLVWNGDSFDKQWSTPKVQGMVTDFAVDRLEGFARPRLITVERKKTDWLSFLRSRSQVRAYDLESLRKKGPGDSGVK